MIQKVYVGRELLPGKHGSGDARPGVCMHKGGNDWIVVAYDIPALFLVTKINFKDKSSSIASIAKVQFRCHLSTSFVDFMESPRFWKYSIWIFTPKITSIWTIFSRIWAFAPKMGKICNCRFLARKIKFNIENSNCFDTKNIWFEFSRQK